jgi:uncharacterized protein (DUF983 family)
MLACKCPKCKEGNLFVNPPVLYKKFGQMPTLCTACQYRFEPEPGFFFGAMYISYGLSIGVIAVCSVLLYYLGGNPGPGTYLLVSLLGVTLLYPLIFQHSRSMYIYLIAALESGERF